MKIICKISLKQQCSYELIIKHNVWIKERNQAMLARYNDHFYLEIYKIKRNEFSLCNNSISE